MFNFIGYYKTDSDAMQNKHYLFSKTSKNDNELQPKFHSQDSGVKISKILPNQAKNHVNALSLVLW